jgi:hypothetical protein
LDDRFALVSGVEGRRPGEVADVVASLVADDARWINTHSMCASGGRHPR